MRRLLAALDEAGYEFVTITPASHARVAARWRGLGSGPRDLFGWSRAVAVGSVPAPVRDAAVAADVLFERDGGLASRVRVSRVEGRLYAHSAWPTDAEDSVFLGPDSYRFARFVRANLPDPRAGLRVVDVGTGAGVGGMVAADALAHAELTLTDINARALDFARHNAAHAGIEAGCVHTRGLDGLDGPFDVVLANPPYIVDDDGRAYRDGGDMLGARVALEVARAALSKLAPGGRLLLYTGSPIVEGRDALFNAIAAAAAAAGVEAGVGTELDPDVFGEELERPAYRAVERIALLGVVAVRPAGDGRA